MALLVASGANVNCLSDPAQQTPLHIAVKEGSYLLLSIKFYQNCSRFIQLQSPLLMPVGHEDFVKALVEAGALLNGNVNLSRDLYKILNFISF